MSDFTGAAAPSDFSQLLKSRFMPYLSTTEQSSSLPFALLIPEQPFHRTECPQQPLVPLG